MNSSLPPSRRASPDQKSRTRDLIPGSGFRIKHRHSISSACFPVQTRPSASTCFPAPPRLVASACFLVPPRVCPLLLAPALPCVWPHPLLPRTATSARFCLLPHCRASGRIRCFPYTAASVRVRAQHFRVRHDKRPASFAFVRQIVFRQFVIIGVVGRSLQIDILQLPAV